jgi:LPS export ABC transporter protein LptC
MLAWQKRARLVVLVVAVGVAAAVFVTTRPRETPPQPAPVTRVDPTAVVESSGAFLVQVKGERENFTIQAEKQLSYSDGSTKLIGVKITSVRQGKTFVATGQEAKVGDDQSHIELMGNVRMTASDGLEVMADSATYSDSERIVRAPGPVAFKRGRMSGTGVDFTYDESRDLISLADKTVVNVAPDSQGANGADITAGSGILGRREKFASFERAVHIVRARQVIDADRALANLTEDEQHLTGLELQGSARITTPDAAPGALTAMSGDVIDLTYADNSDLVQHAMVSGAASVRIAGEKGSPERTLSSQMVEIGMAPDGTTVTSLNARENVALDLPAPRGQTSKNVRSNVLVASGNPGSGLTAAIFTEGVEYRETGGTPPLQRVVTSRSLNAALNGGLGEIRDALFSGDARFKDGSTQATAANIRYQAASGEIELTGNVGNAVPHVADDQIVVDATRIDMTLEGPKLTATGGPQPVRAVMQPAKPGSKDARKTPSLMQPDRPVNGSSHELVYAGGKESTAEFSGAVRLWQGDTSIQSDNVSVDGKTGNLSALGDVRSTFLVQDMNPDKKSRETTRSRGSAQAMVYEEAARKLTYRTGARLDDAQGDLRAGTIVLHLGQNGQDLERLEALEGVTFREKDQLTTGDRLEYVSAAQEYKVWGTGGLARMLRMTAEGCRKSEGSLLQFSRVTDTLRIEGKPETRSQSKSESSCTFPPTK